MSSTTSATRSGRARATVAGLVLAASALTALGCGARPGAAAARTRTARTTRTTPTSSARRATGAGVADAPAPATSGPAPASLAPVCAQVARLYAGLVAAPLGLGDDGDPADRQALATATDALRAQVPAAVAHDLDVLAQAYGAAARALDDAGPRPDQLDQAVTAVTEPAVTDAAHDLGRYVQARCP
jgi:hypothetical protein